MWWHGHGLGADSESPLLLPSHTLITVFGEIRVETEIAARHLF